MFASWKKVFSIYISLVYLATLFNSCTNDNSCKPNDVIPKPKKHVIEAGRLHNEMLANINKDNVLTNREKIGEEEFIERIVTASNEVFRDNNIDYSVSSADVQDILNNYKQMAQNEIFNVFKPIEEREISDIYKLLNYLEDNRNYNPDEIQKIRIAIEEIDAIGISNIDRKQMGQIIRKYKSHDESKESNVALDVLEHSFIFWSDLKCNIENKNEFNTSVEPINPQILKIDWWSIDVLLWDTVGVLLCWPLGPVAVLCGLALSAIYIVVTTWDD